MSVNKILRICFFVVWVLVSKESCGGNFGGGDQVVSVSLFEQAKIQFWRAEMLYRGNGLFQKDFRLAYENLIPVARQTVNWNVRARALCLLGEMYFFGHGVRKNFLSAQRYLTEGLQIQEDLDSGKLGQSFFSPGFQDYISRAQSRIDGVARSNMVLSEIYSLGGDDVPQDMARSREYLKRVIDSERARSDEKMTALLLWLKKSK